MEEEDLYPCVGICTPDPDSGYCLGCGRPPIETPEIIREEPPPAACAENDKTGTSVPAS